VIKYEVPARWIHYEPAQVVSALVAAKSAVLSLRSIPYQRSWVEALQQLELKREVAGTSRIEGAEFTERELDAALKESPAELRTRSQRQAHAAVQTYRWLSELPDDRPIDEGVIREIHRRIVTGADDDHCPPGQIRGRDENVTFGAPRHRGAEGGDECATAFASLARAINREYREHDPLIQALASHYHFAAMHPFLDGNGRTARALEALLLQRAGLRNTCFIAMSNYYYEEKDRYLATLAQVRTGQHDLTAFLVFGLQGIALQAGRLLEEIRHHISKEIFRNLMYDLFNRLKTPRRRVIAQRQIEILKLLLEVESIELSRLVRRLDGHYRSLKNPRKAVIRDLTDLIELQAVSAAKTESSGEVTVSVRLEWPSEITESAFFERIKQLPKAKTHAFLQ
jgi:Fic family protein